MSICKDLREDIEILKLKIEKADLSSKLAERYDKVGGFFIRVNCPHCGNSHEVYVDHQYLKKEVSEDESKDN